MNLSKIPILLLILAVNCYCQSAEETTTVQEESSSTIIPTTSTKVPDRPLKESGCYWTECKSPITYNLKCPPDTDEQNENDEMPCEGIFVKYQCCPRKDEDKVVVKEDKKKSGKDSKPVIPQPV